MALKLFITSCTSIIEDEHSESFCVPSSISIMFTGVRPISAISRMTLRRCFSEAKDHTRLLAALHIWHWPFPEIRLDLSSAHIKIGTLRSTLFDTADPS